MTTPRPPSSCSFGQPPAVPRFPQGRAHSPRSRPAEPDGSRRGAGAESVLGRPVGLRPTTLDNLYYDFSPANLVRLAVRHQPTPNTPLSRPPGSKPYSLK